MSPENVAFNAHYQLYKSYSVKNGKLIFRILVDTVFMISKCIMATIS